MSTRCGLRVLMTTDAVGGVWSYATSLAAALAALGAEIHLVSLGPAPRPDQRAMLRGTDVRLVETDLALEWQDPDAHDLDHARGTLLALERELRPDIVHLNSLREATFDWDAPVLAVAHSCVPSWALACNEAGMLQEPRWQRYSELIAAGLRCADAWVAPTCAFGEVIGRLHAPRRPGTLIWNGLAASTLEAARHEKETFVLAAGRMWDKAKNLSTLSKAADGLACPVLVAGAGSDSTVVTSNLHQLGELSHDELRRWMGRAAIYASPALYEPFGLSVLEAAAAGCALVLSDIPSFRELWQDAAVFVAPADAGAIRSTLNWLAADPRACATLQDAARRRAARYSLHRMAASYAELYGDLLARASSDRRSNTYAEACA
ncbi:glycosyltransferase [Bradyrhizobium sp. 83002]|uniref:glycosyltransferase family 4 protein n=1 Tax=Bradyrhizobium aeschynomenes TaxID=2734909 RepID=UPI001556DC80|nr:glycosyltransferase [Bradyrhizobium aeschynomenes]NPU09903.1 glycosyltransferase [Bradyrhizobium aeschynomenes]